MYTARKMDSVYKCTAVFLDKDHTVENSKQEFVLLHYILIWRQKKLL